MKPKKHTIDSLSVWLDKPAVQQAYTNLITPIIEAKIAAEIYGKTAAGEMYGDDGKDYPVAGEVVISRHAGLVVTMTIEPDTKGGWSGEHLTHNEINAIGISDMVVNGQQLKHKEQ